MKEERAMKVEFVEDEDSTSFGFDFDEFNERLDEASSILYPGEEVGARIMLAKYDRTSFPLGVVFYKDSLTDLERYALRLHLQSLISKLDER